jgi:Ca-activated chloride channel family protein
MSSDAHLDAKLRAVPLPIGLAQKLRAIPLADDEGLDAVVRDVSVAAGLLERLRAIPLAEDEGLDAALREVPLPHGLLARLSRIPLADDEGLDAAVRDVPIPVRLTATWRRRTRRSERGSRRWRVLWVSRLAAAASLLIAVSLTYLAATLVSMVVGRQALTRPNPPEKPSPPDTQSLVESWAAQGPEEKTGPRPLPSEISLAKTDEPRRRPGRTDLGAGLSLPPSDDPLLKPAPDHALGYGVNANPFDELPELPTRRADLLPRGIDWPLVPNSKRWFLIRYGVHPFVTPADHPRLASMTVPLGVDSASFELSRRYLEEGELPPPDLVRTEEFLARDYDFPRPKQGDLGLVVAGGPSPFGGEGLCLLQIGVQSREVSSRHAPVQLILAVDASASMRWGSRSEMLRRALREYAAGLASDDRLSLVSFSQAAHVLIQDVGPAEVRHFLAAVDSLSAEGTTDVAAGLQEAFALGRQLAAPGRPPVRVVLLSDGLLELDRVGMEQIEQEIARAALRGVPLEVVDLGQQKQAESQMAALARSGRGTVRRAVNAQQVGWALREIVSGRTELTARDAQLKVTFQSKAVLEYRLLGHEAKEWAGMLPGAPQADFHDGQSATALYEVRLAANGPKEVAAVELTWYPVGYDGSRGAGGQQKLSRPVGLGDFASSWAGTAPSLQEAALAAQTAEVLRRSPFVLWRNPRASLAACLVRVSDLAGTVDSRLYQRPSFVELAALVDQAIKAKPARSGVRRP